MAETWIINESPNISSGNYSVIFTSNNNNFKNLELLSGPGYNEIDYLPLNAPNPLSYITVYTTDITPMGTGWYNGQAYRTLTFEDSVETAAPDLYAWFNSPASDGVSPNAVKQTPPSTKLTFDLATLDLPTGTYNVKVLPKGDGVNYRDADLAECVAVEYTVEATGETWVIDESPIPDESISPIRINFNSNNNDFIGISMYSAGKPSLWSISYSAVEGGRQVWDGLTGWTNQAYRTVYFPEPPTGDLRTWLQNNATLQ